MDMSTFAVIAAGIACAFSAYMLWQSKRDGLSFIDEIKRQLDSHKTSTVNAAVKAVQAATAVPVPVPATPVAMPPVAPAVDAHEGSGVVINRAPLGVAPSFWTPPKETPVRDEMTEGPKIAEWLSAHYPSMMPKVSRVIHTWATHQAFSYDDARMYVFENRDLAGDALANAIGQQHREEEDATEGVFFKGPYPIGSASLADMYYLMHEMSPYYVVTGRDIFGDVFYGSVVKVNALKQEAGELHAPEMAAFDPTTYQGPLRPIVESRMNGR